MRRIKGNLFEMPKDNKDAICVTTNGMIKNNGKAVMGAGIAKAFVKQFWGIDMTLAGKLRNHGNHAYDLGLYGNGFHIFSFPTKHDWRDNSNLELIEQSCKELVVLCNQLGIQNCYLPLPGCTNGHLDSKVVIPMISEILDDRFVLVLQ